MIPQGTLLATDPPIAVEDTLGTYVLCSAKGGGKIPVYAYPVGESDTLVQVETWYEASCRDCLHHSNVGSFFAVSLHQGLVLRNGDFAPAEELKNGTRLLAAGCKCGYLVVKNVGSTSSGYPLDFFGVAAETYGITDGHHTIYLRGTNSRADD